MLEAQMEWINQYCPIAGTGSFCFPIGSVSNNGSVGIYTDSRDKTAGLWMVFGQSGIVFPELL